MSGLQKLLVVTLLLVVLGGGYYYYQTQASTTLATTITTNPDLETGLIGHWTFDGEDIDVTLPSAEIRDRSGNSKHIDWIDHATTTVPGVIGQALEFDGYNDGLRLENDTLFTQIEPNGFSGFAWMYPVASSSAGRFTGHVFTRQFTNFVLRTNSSFADQWRCGIRNETNTQIEGSSVSLKPHAWSYVGCVFSTTTKELLTYVNGVEVDSTDASLFNYFYHSDTNDFTIGYSDDTSGRHFTGRIDDVRMYNREVTAAEVTRLFDLGNTTRVAKTITTNPDLENGLVGHWTFDGADMDLSSSTREILDRSGQGNHLDWVNHATTTVSGVMGQALEFDGKNNYADRGQNVLTQVEPNGFSGFAWMYARASTTGRPTGPVFSRQYDNFAFDATSSGDPDRWRCIIRDDTSGLIHGGYVTLPRDTWMHVGCVFSTSTKELLMYVDGVERDSTDASGFSAFRDTDDNTFFYIGRDDPINNTLFTGKLDDVRIYNRSLSPAEVKRLYQLGN